MNILFVNHGEAGQFGGGDATQMRETATRLSQRGHRVVAVNSDTPDPRGFDLVHIFNCRAPIAFESQIAACRAADVPTVVSPIWVSIPQAIWGSRGSMAVVHQLATGHGREAERALDQLRDRTLNVTLTDGTTIDEKGNGSHDLSWIKRVGELLQNVDGLLPNSWLELKAIQRDLNWSGDCFEIAHYGVDPRIFLDADPEPFRRETGIQGPFVIQAGRIEPAKNQLMMCWALRESSLPVVLVGNKRTWQGFSDLCQQILGERLTIIDHMPQELLASAFSAAKVHVLPSWMETCGLVTLEAALTGTPVVGSTFGHELEYLQNDCWWADPANPDSIKHAIEAAWRAEQGHERPIRLKRRILENYNWEKNADMTEKLYKKVLTQRKRLTPSS